MFWSSAVQWVTVLWKPYARLMPAESLSHENRRKEENNSITSREVVLLFTGDTAADFTFLHLPFYFFFWKFMNPKEILLPCSKLTGNKWIGAASVLFCSVSAWCDTLRKSFRWFYSRSVFTRVSLGHYVEIHWNTYPLKSTLSDHKDMCLDFDAFTVAEQKCKGTLSFPSFFNVNPHPRKSEDVRFRTVSTQVYNHVFE